MKRVLCIVGGMNAGGAETFLMKIYRALDRTKYQMDFAVAIQGEGFYDKEILSMGGKIHHIVPKTSGALKNFKDIKGLVKSNHYEYVLRTSQSSLSALELLAAKKGGAKVRAFRSSNSNVCSSSKKQALVHKLCMFMPKRFANVRIAPSTEAAEFMFGKGCIGKGKAHLLHNAVDLSVFRYDEGDRQRIRNEFHLSSGTLLLGHIGRFNQQKNHLYLLKVFYEVLKSNPDCALLLVGKGEEEQKIKEEASRLGLSDKIIFAGVRSDVPALLSAMDAFVFPSLYEGMPNTVIEAQATGLPCLIADTITREADITGLVHYLPLSSPTEWADFILGLPKGNRVTQYDRFKQSQYDIDSSVKEFIRLVFQD